MTNTPLGNTATLEVLLREAQWLRRLAVHLVQDPDEAADIVQETWITALRAGPDTDRPIRGWLGRVALNLARRRARSEGRRDRHETAAASDAAAPTPLADSVMERMELQRIVAERVMALEEPLRSTVCLHYYDGLTSTQVGQALGEPEGTIRWRLKEARDRLRTELDRRCNGRRHAWAAVLAPSAWAKIAPAGSVGNVGNVGRKAALGTPGKVGVAAAVVVLAAAGLVWRAHRPEPEEARRYAWSVPAGASLRIFGAPAPTPAGGLAGLVREADGRAAASVVVTLRRRSGRPARDPATSALTAGDGSFAFHELPDGAYDLTAASAQSLSASAGPVEIRRGASVRDVVLTLGSGGHLLSGRLLDGGGGSLPGAQLQARLGEATFTARADGQGQYRLRLARGNYRLEADADGYAARTGGVELVGDMVRDFRLDPAGRLVGSVVDGASGKPVAGAIVRAEAGERPPTVAHTTSDEHGRFAFGDLLPGEYMVSARAGARAGFRSGHLAVPVAGEIDAGQVLLEPAFEITGRIASADGKPVAAKVLVDTDLFDHGALGGAVMTTSGADGRYRIEGVAPGRMRVRAGGVLPWAPSASALVAVKDASVRQDFTLPAGGKLDGQLLGADGSQVAGATVMAGTHDSDAVDSPVRGDGRGTTDADGRFAIGGLGAGKIQIEVVDRRWGRLQNDRLTLAPGQTVTTTLTFPAPATVAGTVTWDSGGPAAAVRVRWVPFGRGGREPQTITDQAGHFQLGPCSPGTGVVQAELPTEHRVTGGTRAPHQRLIDLAAGATATDVALVLARNDKTISGVALDPSGRPLADATVGVEEDHGQGTAIEHRSETMVRTDPEGRFLLDHLTRGRYVLWATHAEYPAVDRPGTEAGTSGHRLRFPAGSRLTGTVKDERGSPARLYTMLLVSAEGPGHTNGIGSGRLVGREERVNDPGGAFSIGRVAPGSYDLLVTAPDGRVARAAALTVGAGERKEGLALVLRPAVTLRGKVVDSETGAPLAGVRMVVMGTRELAHASSDGSGAFALTGQIPGRTLMVEAIPQRGYVPAPREIGVPSDRETVDLYPFRLMLDPRQRPAPPTPDLRPFGDAGLRLADREDGMTIEAVVPGSLAARQGLRPGDRIVAVGGRDVRGMGAFAAAMLLRGPLGSSVEITLAGDGGAGRKVTVERSAAPVVASGR